MERKIRLIGLLPSQLPKREGWGSSFRSHCSPYGGCQSATARHWAWVIGVRPIRNSPSSTWCWGPSRPMRFASPSGEPITKRPAGMRTMGSSNPSARSTNTWVRLCQRKSYSEAAAGAAGPVAVLGGGGLPLGVLMNDRTLGKLALLRIGGR